MSPPRFALIGPPQAAGAWLLASLRRHGTFEAICHADAEREAAKWQARWTFSDSETMLREAEPAGVVITEPFRDRHRLVRQCLSAGACVLLTGAPCTAAQARRLALLARVSGRCVLAAPPTRYAPAVMMARRIMDSGKLASPISIVLHSTRRGAPRTDETDDGPVPIDQIFEAVDLIQLMLGPIGHVTALAHDEGVMIVAAETASRVPVSMVLHASGPAEAIGVEMEIRSADGACLRIDRGFHLTCGNGSRIDAVHRPSLSANDPAVELGYDGLLAEFSRLLRPRLGLGLIGQVGTVLSTVEAISTSAAKGRMVKVRPMHAGEPAAELPAGTAGA